MKRSIPLTKRLILNFFLVIVGFILLSGIIAACSSPPKSAVEIERAPLLDPDYSGITIPPNIAPLNFTILEKADAYLVKLYSSGGQIVRMASSSGNIKVSSKAWKKLLEQSKGKEMWIDVAVKKQRRWYHFQPIVNHVATEPVDRYLVYRLFDQGYLTWNKMGIYQRCLENFDELPVMVNTMSGRNCMNCHSFCKNSGKTMLFHVRGKKGGTVLSRQGQISYVNTKTSRTISPGVYPSWHPNGRHVAFSTNHIAQAFYAAPNHDREAIDSLSDLILYDAETHKISTCSAISSKDRLETFPAWSPDGRYLYFISALALPPHRYKEIKYDLLRIAYDPETRLFSTVDTVVSSARTGLSVSFPRISPDGKYLLFCMTAYGNFTIWHKDSDLYLLNLETEELTKPDLNSDQAESYHTWSSTGRWIVFSSRRSDGFFTQLYLSYFDPDGKAHKPFLLPQKSPGFYKTFLKSYNVPELITSKIGLSPRVLSKMVRSVSENVQFEQTEQITE